MRSSLRATLQFMALMAVGLVVAVAMAMVLSGGYEPGAVGAVGARRSAMGIEYGSFAAGMAAGIVLAWIGRISWSLQLRQMLAWLLDNRRLLRRASYGMVFVAILLFY